MSTSFEEFSKSLVSVGDVIETEVTNPYPRTLRVKINTPEACATANDLVMCGRWKKSADSKSNESH